jgi:hypothetical protein
MTECHPAIERLQPAYVTDLVRIGRDHDGGYVVSARTVDRASALIGLGINDEWSFEQEFMRRNSAARLVAVDGSISKTRFLRDALWHGFRSAVIAGRGRFSESGTEWRSSRNWWSIRASFLDFFFKPNRVFVERMIGDIGGGSEFSWNDIVQDLSKALPASATPAWFVKMDIEGAEYRVLPELIPNAHMIAGMVVEFHDCDLFSARIDKLMQLILNDFVVVHTHGNNSAPLIAGTNFPRVIEVSFMNRLLLTAADTSCREVRTYPIPELDRSNRPGGDDYVFLR